MCAAMSSIDAFPLRYTPPMLAQVHSFVLQGIDPLACEVEVDVAEEGLPKTTIVGLPDAAVKESIERVRSAMVNSGFPFPLARLLVNLAPADIRKEGPAFDLPIALGLLIAERVIRSERHREFLFAGELALDGRLRPIRGAINLALLAREHKMAGLIVPEDNAEEAAGVGGVKVYPVQTLAQVVGFLNEVDDIQPLADRGDTAFGFDERAEVDFADIRGQEAVKRAAMLAAAGAHNLLMLGPAGTGKTMIAKAMPGILPPLTREEALEITRIYSAVGQVPAGQSLIRHRPVRTPHHTASSAAVIGGGTIPKPGEVSLAHRGVLFLDEVPEFPRTVLETLRQPLEDGYVTISRAHSSIRFPARFLMLGAMNPTPKGDKPTDEFSHRQMQRYLARLSGPFIDRVDLHVEVPPVPYQQLSGERRGTGSAELRERVVAARQRAIKRNGSALKPNSALTGRELDRVAVLDDTGRELLRQAMSELNLSARAYDKIRRVARTIADVDDADVIRPEHVAEAVQYRLLDREL